MPSSVATATATAPSSSSQSTPAQRQNIAEQQGQGPTASKSEDDFFWTYTEEPHRTRRQAIIQAHPEVTKLCGPEPLTKYLVFAVVSLQICCAYVLRSTPFFSWKFFIVSYIIGATANQNLFLAIHEISHNLAFKSPDANRILAIVANLPIGIPYSASFRPYHLTHHKSLGVDGYDADLPTSLEAVFFSSLLGKAFFCTFQILFYAIRPMFVYKLPITQVHILNIVAQILFDVFLVKMLGGKALGYLIFSSFLAGSLHPCAAHFIAEHYIFSTGKLDSPASRSRSSLSKSSESDQTGSSGAITVPKPEETYSYYGPLNILTYNVGLHNEHHDFPAVPWTRLPKLHDIAKEFYDDLPSHSSWVWVLWQFVMDDNVGLWCRVKRKGGGRKVGLNATDIGE